MTLIIAIHNGSDIVTGADSLAIHTDLTGASSRQSDFQKIYPVGDKAVLLIAGILNTGRGVVFMNSFSDHCQDNRLFFPDLITDSFFSDGPANLRLSHDEVIEILIAGFDKYGSPSLQKVDRRCGDSGRGVTNKYKPISTYYELGGNKEPMDYAEKLIKDAGVCVADMSTKELSVFTEEILEECIREFPDKLGGKPNVQVLLSVT